MRRPWLVDLIKRVCERKKYTSQSVQSTFAVPGFENHTTSDDFQMSGT